MKISTGSLRTIETRVEGKCRREWETKRKCGFFQTCIDKHVRETTVTRTFDSVVKQEVFFRERNGQRRNIGALAAGERKAFVPPRDGQLTLAPIAVDSAFEKASDETKKLCPANEELTSSSVKYWFETNLPNASILICRGGIDAGQCPDE